ncbi:MAG: LptF/LptG family permease [Prevotella sp.]|nr:LptF/LptG family permease [Prevotella sp.]
MRPIKRLYLYILQEFLPMLFMTFAICLFILVMQFMWKYVEDIVGKGLDALVLAELFMYATLMVIPMALPLAILLASLMTFGNLGERVELTAIKASGISLLKTMRPLIIVIIIICIGAFYFQNEMMPKINVKVNALMRSIKEKSPELDIPEDTFYNSITNYNLYVRHKNPDTGVLYDVIIYDTSEGFDRTRIIVCDSAKLKMSAGKDYLLLSLFYGQQFANFNKSGSGTASIPRKNSFVPYSREDFRKKEIVIPFDANFNRMDESALQSTQIAKNIRELQNSIDSLTVIVDSLNILDRRMAKNQLFRITTEKDSSLAHRETIDIDSLMNTFSTQSKTSLYSNAISITEMNKSDLLYRSMPKMNTGSEIRYHKVEWHRKFTLSFACLIFFFIGAPLGAIIRKGGLGMPVVVSVILFIIYYIIDNVGRKMARDGVWDAWQGIWLSSFVLFPLGCFLTYKAMNDSALLNIDAYRNMYFRLFGNPKTKSMEQLTRLFAKDIKYTLILYFTVLLSLACVIFASGFAATFLKIILWTCMLCYILFYIKAYSEYEVLTETAGSKKNAKDAALSFITGLFAPFTLYFGYLKSV